VVYSRPQPATPENKKVKEIDWKTANIDIWIGELERAFCEFSQQAVRLARLAQQKKECSIPSDAFNHLLSERISEVELTFEAYIRRKEELLTNIKTTSQRSRFYDRQETI
jgi:hypothetical protein